MSKPITHAQHDLVIAYFQATEEMLKQFTRADFTSVMQELANQKQTYWTNQPELNRIELQYGLFEKMLSFKTRAGDP